MAQSEVVALAFGNAKAERQAIEKLYEDVATIQRTGPGRKVGAMTLLDYETVIDGQICGLSYASDGSRQTGAQQDLSYDAVLFIAPELSILPGDQVIVRRFGRDNPDSNILLTFEVVGVPPVYATHQEVRLKASGLS